jgi:hypothetical protein
VANFYWYLDPGSGRFLGSAFPQYKEVLGTNYPAYGLYYDTTTVERAYFRFKATNYASGDLSLKIEWYADTASSGGVVWETALAAITPNTDTQDVETKGFASVNTASDTHIGTTGQRLHEVTVTMNNLDSLIDGDSCMLRVSRLTTDGSDNMAGDAVLYGLELSYLST